MFAFKKSKGRKSEVKHNQSASGVIFVSRITCMAHPQVQVGFKYVNAQTARHATSDRQPHAMSSTQAPTASAFLALRLYLVEYLALPTANFWIRARMTLVFSTDFLNPHTNPVLAFRSTPTETR